MDLLHELTQPSTTLWIQRLRVATLVAVIKEQAYKGGSGLTLTGGKSLLGRSFMMLQAKDRKRLCFVYRRQRGRRGHEGRERKTKQH